MGPVFAERPPSQSEPWFIRLQRLMPHRVREILLVSSRYDAFILEEDGPLSERVFSEYSELSLPWYPGVVHASTGEEALSLLRDRRIDLVITTTRLGDTDPNRLGRAIKAQSPGTPVVLLTFSEADLRGLGGVDPAGIDQAFVWSGDARILFAIHKLVEDWRNVDYDTKMAGVPVIIMVEDSIRHYSTCLIHLYFELVQQAQSLVAEGVNNLHKLLRLRTRPKVLLTSTYEEALAVYDRYREHVLALITDVEFPKGGEEDPEAGFKLVETIREDLPDLPVLLQSANATNARRAWELRTHYVDKRGSNLSREIHRFVSDSLGFGDFVFRLPDRTEVARARDTWEMERALASVPIESIRYHASRNHFSIWLRARGMFHLADMLRSRSLDEFRGDLEKARATIIEVVRRALFSEHDGMVTDFTTQQTAIESRVVRVGKGSIGGKARGIAFAASLLARWGDLDMPGLPVKVPRTIIIGTEEFDRFIDANDLHEVLERTTDDQEILRAFLDAQLPEDLQNDLEAVWRTINGPLAVRSSSLLEDLQFQPFSGIYATYMLPNNHPDPAERFAELRRAIKAVWASTYSENARAYVASTPFMPEEEKMAVAIQYVVGQQHGDRYYPHISGIALSHNYYPVKGQKAGEGVALLALGLGHIVVHGGHVLRFSPRNPAILPQFNGVKDLLRYSQRRFLALDMGRHTVDFEQDCESSLSFYDLEDAEHDGTLALAASVYSPEDDAIRDNLATKGRRVVTFNNVLKWNAIPLAPALDHLLRIVREAMGCAVEIEFAVDMGDWGKSVGRGQRRREPCLYVLQIRPLATSFLDRQLEAPRLEPENLLAHTRAALGHGVLEDLRDVVYVKRGPFDMRKAQAIASEVGAVATELRDAGASFALIGPGRWGTSDPRLGIPVHWSQIAGASLIVETPVEGRAVEPSQGTHFFQNITSLGIGYLTVEHTTRPEDPETNWLDLDWLDAQPAAHETESVRHVRLEQPLMAWLDGQRGRATILKPHVEVEPPAEENAEASPRAASR